MSFFILPLMEGEGHPRLIGYRNSKKLGTPRNDVPAWIPHPFHKNVIACFRLAGEGTSEVGSVT